MAPRRTRASKAAAKPPTPPPAEPSTSPEVEQPSSSARVNGTRALRSQDHAQDEEDEEEEVSPRQIKSTAPSPSPALGRDGSRSKSRSRSRKLGTGDSDEGGGGAAGGAGGGVTVLPEVAESSGDEEPESSGDAVDEQVENGADEEDGEDGTNGDAEEDEAGNDAEGEVLDKGKGKDTGKMSMEERLAKLKDLRIRMASSSLQNRKDLVADHQKSRVTAKELARLEKQKKLAHTLRLKAEAEETGEDMERKKNWEWSIEQNERWEAKLEDQKVRGDTHFHNAEDDAHKKYNRNIRSTKPDLVHYERQKEAALGLAPGTLVPAGATSSSLAASSSGSKARGLTAMEDLYRGADTMSYGDSKPTEDAVDRLTAKINKDIGKGGKKKKRDESNDEVNYINERNKVFNKKIARYFDKYTKEIRANFERGTAL